MANLSDNITTMKKIENMYGSMDEFVLSDSPENVVQLLSNCHSKYKLKGIGAALAWEYLRNVGIDGSKPDLHLKRFFGSDRMGIFKQIEATDDEVIEAVSSLAKRSGYTKFEVDYLIWSYCASGKGEICTANPNCSRCVIKNYCNK